MRENDHFRKMLEDFYSFSGMMSQAKGDTWTPPTDVYETETDIVIKMSLPGLKAEDIGVRFSGDTVLVCGYRGSDEQEKIASYHQMEIRNGYFQRKVIIHKPINPEKARARYDNGFLKIYVPKAERRIEKVVSIRLDL